MPDTSHDHGQRATCVCSGGRVQREAPAARSELSALLRDARCTAGLTQAQAADDLGWSVSKVVRIENGQVGLSRTDVKALAAAYGVADPDIGHLVELAADGRRPLFGAYRDVFTPEFLVYVGFESFANRLQQLAMVAVPELLQTAEYAEAMIRSTSMPGTPEATVSRHVEARLARQAVLDRDNHKARFIIDEASLLRGCGTTDADDSIRAGQFDHLRRLAQRRSVSVQVLPLHHGPHLGLLGSVTILEFDQSAQPGIVHLENGRPSVLVRDRPAQVQAYTRALDDLQQHATPPHHLSDVLDTLMRNVPLRRTAASTVPEIAGKPSEECAVPAGANSGWWRPHPPVQGADDSAGRRRN